MSNPATPAMGPAPGGSKGKGGYAGAGPQSPSLGPAGRNRVGSVTGGAWQLVQIAGNRPATISRSNQASPVVPLLDSSGADDGWSLDGPAPGGQEMGDENQPPARVRKNWAEQEIGGDSEWPPSYKEPASKQEATGENSEDFDSSAFLGEWLDNLGHQIIVTQAERWGGRRGRRGDSNVNRLVYTANLQKVGVPDKRFTIALDRGKPPQWRCGNGSLVQEESSTESLSWKAEDGRISHWTRPVPDGPVYFDAPPSWGMNNYVNYEGMPAWGMMGDMQMESIAFNPDAPEFVPTLPTPSPSPAMKPISAPSRSRASPQMTPMQSPAIRPGWGRTPTPSPMIRPLASPMLTAQNFPLLGQAMMPAPAVPVQLLLSEESPDAIVSGAKMEWNLPDNWGKLGKFPKDFCITSPMFGITEDAANMQLAFYPNGSREAEPGHCTVQLTRGPDSAGMKFEFTVNGRSIGSKACMGRRYLGDYPKPFDDSEESKAQKVVITMQVLEIFGVSGTRS